MTLLDLDLTGKSALVTGATAGIGLVVAEGLARQNAEVWVNGRSQQRVESAVELTLEHVAGANVKGVVGDVSTADGVDAVISKVPEVDVLVNTAGGTRRVAPFVELTDAEWQLNWDLNVMSGVRLSRHYLPRMLATGWGRILLFSSNAGSYIPEHMVNYGVTKSAVESLARALAEQTAGTGVTSNCIVPGPTLSDWVLDAAAAKGLTPQEFEAEYFPGDVASSLLKRFLKAEEVADMVLYVSSPASSGTNGAVLRVEGGILRHR